MAAPAPSPCDGGLAVQDDGSNEVLAGGVEPQIFGLSEQRLTVLWSLSGREACTLPCPLRGIEVKKAVASQLGIALSALVLLLDTGCEVSDDELLESSATVLIQARSTESTEFLDAIQTNPDISLADRSEFVRADPECVKAAVFLRGCELTYASPDIQGDKDIVFVAVKSDGRALRFASRDLQNDSAIVLEAVKQNGLALQHASSDVRTDPQVALAAVQQSALAFKFVGERAKIDYFVCEQALKGWADFTMAGLDTPRIDAQFTFRCPALDMEMLNAQAAARNVFEHLPAGVAKRMTRVMMCTISCFCLILFVSVILSGLVAMTQDVQWAVVPPVIFLANAVMAFLLPCSRNRFCRCAFSYALRGLHNT